jgi:cytochrome c-type biogenesis protein CcmH/NrfG
LRFAQALWQTDQYYQAMNEWRAVLSRSPGNVDARLLLARAYVRTGNLSEAAAEYRRLIQISPARTEARQELARLPSAARQ